MPDTVPGTTVAAFMELFQGYEHAFGTGAGGWVKRPPRVSDFQAHLAGRGTGIGIGPLREDGTCSFSAIDLDKPDFTLARELAKLLPGVSWIERSRSGNAHILIFFSSPIEAWVARGFMHQALYSLEQRDVEVFPKADKLLPGMFGSYLNLPYFGDTRKVIARCENGVIDSWGITDPARGAPLEKFLEPALRQRNDPDVWRKRAWWFGIKSPQERAHSAQHEFGTAPVLHMCAEYVLKRRFTHPVTEGHRAVVFFGLAKMLANWSEIDDEEALRMLADVNDASPDPIPTAELQRIYQNASRRGYTSTGCDDVLFEPYAHPDCPIAHPKDPE